MRCRLISMVMRARAPRRAVEHSERAREAGERGLEGGRVGVGGDDECALSHRVHHFNLLNTEFTYSLAIFFLKRSDLPNYIAKFLLLLLSELDTFTSSRCLTFV